MCYGYLLNWLFHISVILDFGNISCPRSMVWLLFLNCAIFGRKLLLELNWKLLEVVGLTLKSWRAPACTPDRFGGGLLLAVLKFKPPDWPCVTAELWANAAAIDYLWLYIVVNAAAVPLVRCLSDCLLLLVVVLWLNINCGVWNVSLSVLVPSPRSRVSLEACGSFPFFLEWAAFAVWLVLTPAISSTWSDLIVFMLALVFIVKLQLSCLMLL